MLCQVNEAKLIPAQVLQKKLDILVDKRNNNAMHNNIAPGYLED